MRSAQRPRAPTGCRWSVRIRPPRRRMANRMLASFLRIGRRKESRSAEDQALRGFARDGLPMVWFDRAERLGLLVELELACVRSALRCLGDLPDDVRLSINVSPRTAITTELVELVAPVGERVII